MKATKKFFAGYAGFISVTIPIMLLLVLWQLTPVDRGPSTVSTGWSKLRPLSASIAYKANGSFEATFQNTVGTTIRLTSIMVNETLTSLPNDCVVQTVNNLAWTEGTTEVSVKAGDGFEIGVDCAANSAKEVGDPFDLLITINYTAVMGGVNTYHTETGHIHGPVEA